MASSSLLLWCDALAHPWDNIYRYAFPPFTQISKIFYKVAHHLSGTIILICPFWPSQPWFPRLSSYVIDFPFLLPPSSTLLRNRGNPDTVPPLFRQLRFIGCKLSANNYIRTNFHLKLLTSCSPVGKETRKRTSRHSFASGYHFALNDITIPVLHL